jgi:branched-chain amino acid transport system substrate-binding protein
MGKSFKLAAVAGTVAILAAACGSSSSGTSTSAGASSSTAPSTGTSASSGGGKTVVVGVDLPFQGASADASNATFNAMQLYLDTVTNKAGAYTVTLKKYDDSTAAAGAWAASQCASNATAHVQNADELAVMGTYNSGCAQIEIPVLEQAPQPMLMVSDANTYPGLTKAWDTGEPGKYYPKTVRNYARVVTTDDYQGAAAAQFAKQYLKVTKCYVLNDNQTYGQGVAKAFVTEAKKQGLTILGNEAWDAKASNYTAVFNKIKTLNPDCIYIAGIFDNNGGQLVKDKVAVLGDNTTVKMLGPDGFTGYPDLDKLPQAQGMYLTFAGLATEQLLKITGPGQTLLTAYKAKYGSYPSTNYALYGVQALQVIMKAIAGSDGTRQSVTNQVFSGSGISIPAADAVLGKDITIDPKTGDVNAKDISVLLLKGNQEGFLEAWPVQSD